MSLTGKKWQIYKPEKELSKQLAEETKTSSVVSQIFINRGILSASEITSFLNPELSSLFDPAEIPDMQKAADRVKLAKERGEKVAVYGDYDVDGVTGTSILFLALKKLGIDVKYYVPHRYAEGYGMNLDAVTSLHSEGVKLLITVDCGVSNVLEIEHANSLGVEVIVTDHHTPPKKLPPAYAIVNPKLMDKNHKSRDLSGAGVAFKFAWGIYRTFGIKESDDLLAMLDLVGLGTIADIVPLIDENRILAVYGIKRLNEQKRIGLRALLDIIGNKKKITANQVNFMISPRLNAAGRLEHASMSIELLTSDDENVVRDIAKALNKVNVKRQGIGKKIQEEVFAKIDENAVPKLIVLDGEDWHPGVIGIVASRVVDKFYRPAILIGIKDGIGRGSARSIDGFNIYEALNKCRNLFTDFGGHEKAAGFEIKQENIPEFKKKIEQIADQEINLDNRTPKLLIDSEVKPNEINMSLAMELDSLSPFGEKNPKPLLLTRSLKILEQRTVGDGSHLKVRFTDGKITLESIGFGLGHLSDELKYDNEYEIVYNLGINEFNGFETAQLNLVDIRSYN